MDFARPHSIKQSIVSTSNIRVVDAEEPHASEDHQKAATSREELDQMVVRASNQATRDLILASYPVELRDDRLADASLYTERSIPRKETIQVGDLVVIMESFDRLTFAYIEEKGMYSNRHGHFSHEDFIGKPFGSKVRSRNNQGYGFCYLLKPTPELWARSLTHRTQIVHELDQSQIIFQLYLRPNMTVVESGTGSGAMSHAILRTIAPHGKLHSYEFNKMRADTARIEFEKNGVSHLVTVHHRDVCAKIEAEAGFDLPPSSVDAVFLDLPEPWHAVPHAAKILKPNARIASYSPCVEQTQKSVEAMKKAGFHSMKTMEYRLQEHYVDEIVYKSPPKAKRPKFEAHDNEARIKSVSATGSASGNGEQSDDLSDEFETEDDGALAGDESGEGNEIKAKMVVARPFASMRGHSAFLTFATAGLRA
jgi:tRNA (adenine57-N1/adenine58-N1)-methyltransferase